MTFDNLRYEKDADGIATITWDMPERTMNVLSQASMADFAKAVDMAASDGGVTGIIVTSAKPAFLAGADLEEQPRARRPERGAEASERGARRGEPPGGIEHRQRPHQVREDEEEGDAEGQVRAASFVVDRAHEQYTGELALEATAELIRHAVGVSGPGIEYLRNTVHHMEALGLATGELKRILQLIEG